MPYPVGENYTGVKINRKTTKKDIKMVKIYSTFDKIAKAYNSNTFQAPNDEVAVRTIKNAQMQDKFLNNNAQDYELWCVAVWDNDTGTMTADKRLVHELKKIEE
ncbi:nonstructural protein [Dipodfec virus UOA04_Rod_724]|nr:nonstructural protein [Dipodfec virus UOA04_Rod_724]